MKPSILAKCILILLAQPATAQPEVADLTGQAWSRSNDRAWVKVRTRKIFEKPDNQFSLDETHLARINYMNGELAFNSGELRRTPPSASAPPPKPQEPARIRFEDSLAKLSTQNNLSIYKLLHLNPHFQAPHLVAGTKIHVAKSIPEQNSTEKEEDKGYKWMWPTSGIFISGYGLRESDMHTAIDIANKPGTSIVAARSGIVESVQSVDHILYLIEIRHPDGSKSRYIHSGRTFVGIGQTVKQGAIISEMGSATKLPACESLECSIKQPELKHIMDEFRAVAGRTRLNPEFDAHLHFEILPDGRTAENPLRFLPAKATGKSSPNEVLDFPRSFLTEKEMAPCMLEPRSKCWEPALAVPKAPLLPSAKASDQSLNELIRRGVVTPENSNLTRTGTSRTPMYSRTIQPICRGSALSARECRDGIPLRWGRVSGLPWTSKLDPSKDRHSATVKPLSPNEKHLLHKIRSGYLTPQWRTYGKCTYDWAGWKLHANGTRTTAVDCGGTSNRWIIAVSCDRLLVATHTTTSGWSRWARPAGPDSKFRQGEDEMVAALCANVL